RLGENGEHRRRKNLRHRPGDGDPDPNGRERRDGVIVSGTSAADFGDDPAADLFAGGKALFQPDPNRLGFRIFQDLRRDPFGERLNEVNGGLASEPGDLPAEPVIVDRLLQVVGLNGLREIALDFNIDRKPLTDGPLFQRDPAMAVELDLIDLKAVRHSYSRSTGI